MKLRVGIVFGGFSREREISFAGGRTVYDNLNKILFEPVPLFVDSFGNFIEIDWQYIYKGSIRDFYPPVDAIPDSSGNFQIYAESLGSLDQNAQEKLINKIGKRVDLTELASKIDFAFLCLHGPFGEDGRVQGLLEYYGIPYSGSGIFASAFGINKAIQKTLMRDAGFDGPDFTTLTKTEFEKIRQNEIAERILKEVSLPFVIKPAHQGSSIGVSVITEKNNQTIIEAINKAFFIEQIQVDVWKNKSEEQKINFIRSLVDIRQGIGLPVNISAGAGKKIIFHPDELLMDIENIFSAGSKIISLEAIDGESEIVVEQFIDGKEFSCIVIRNENGNPVALPPTGIRKGKELFDYRSKYLPGLSRKITPIELPYEQIQKIRQECERLFEKFSFNVYARIDGFVNENGKIFLNDPNTTSGMLPSSFFFHQAAEIGLNPSQFLTFIIRNSIAERRNDLSNKSNLNAMLNELDKNIEALKKENNQKIRVAVIMGGYSSERHISVESGRNVFEKLSSSDKYIPFPVFLTGNDNDHQLYMIPVNLMLKDNADDIKEKALHYSVHEVIKEIMMLCENITMKYTSSQSVLQPKQITYDQLSQIADVAFIALHGRPGEDGEIQKQLERVGVPYNGSGVASSRITINKFETNELLKQNGFLVANHRLVNSDEWLHDKNKILAEIESDFTFPLIAKPVDDGCSSAVKKIRSRNELIDFGDAIFRNTDELSEKFLNALHLKAKEEFPRKKQFLIEELITKNGAKHFLEITGGMLTKTNESGERIYEVFEASEALSGGDVLSLEEKFLAGEGQNITPAQYAQDPKTRQKISDAVKKEFLRAAALLDVEGYARIDAFVRIFPDDRVETIFIEVNSLPGMTPATCIFHQTAIAGYKPYDFIDKILSYGMQRKKRPVNIS